MCGVAEGLFNQENARVSNWQTPHLTGQRWPVAYLNELVQLNHHKDILYKRGDYSVFRCCGSSYFDS